jgi:histidyl-tRNA synthetase
MRIKIVLIISCLIGDEENLNNKIVLKNLKTKEQKIFNQSEIKLDHEIR